MVELPYLQGDIGGGDMSRSMSNYIFDIAKNNKGAFSL